MQSISSLVRTWLCCLTVLLMASSVQAAPSSRPVKKVVTKSKAAATPKTPANTSSTVSKKVAPKVVKTATLKKKTNTDVFSVNGETFPYSMYRVLLQGVRYRLRLNWRMIKRFRIDKLVLNQLIDRMVMAQAAKQQGIQVTKKEVLQRIHSVRSFRRGGKFVRPLYLRILKYMRINEQIHLRLMTNRMLAERLEKKWLGKVQYSEDKAKAAFKEQFTRIRLRILSLNVKTLSAALNKELTAAAVQAYVNKNKSRLKLLFQLVKRRRYQRPEKIRARHILLRLAPNAKPAQVAAVTKKMQRLHMLVSRAPRFFQAIARKFSQGPSKTRGGDLGFFARGQMVKPFSKAAFALKKPKQVSGIVRTRFGLHIIQLVARQPAVNRKFDASVQNELARELIVQSKTSTLANTVIKKWLSDLQSGKTTWAKLKAEFSTKAIATTRPSTQPSSRPTTQSSRKPNVLRAHVSFRLTPFFRRGKGRNAGLNELRRKQEKDVFALTLAKPYLNKPIKTAKRMEIWKLAERKQPNDAIYQKVRGRWLQALKRKKLRGIRKGYIKELRKKATIKITKLPLIRPF